MIAFAFSALVALATGHADVTTTFDGWAPEVQPAIIGMSWQCPPLNDVETCWIVVLGDGTIETGP